MRDLELTPAVDSNEGKNETAGLGFDNLKTRSKLGIRVELSLRNSMTGQSLKCNKRRQQDNRKYQYGGIELQVVGSNAFS